MVGLQDTIRRIDDAWEAIAKVLNSIYDTKGKEVTLEMLRHVENACTAAEMAFDKAAEQEKEIKKYVAFLEYRISEFREGLSEIDATLLDATVLDNDDRTVREYNESSPVENACLNSTRLRSCERIGCMAEDECSWVFCALSSSCAPPPPKQECKMGKGRDKRRKSKEKKLSQNTKPKAKERDQNVRN